MSEGYSLYEIRCLVHKTHWVEAAKLCVKSPQHLNTIVNTMLDYKGIEARRSAEVARHVSDLDMSLISPYLSRICERILSQAEDGVLRSALHILQQADIPEDHTGKTYDRCQELMMDTKNPIAIRVFAMTTMYNIARPYPELMVELKQLISEQLAHESSAGFHSRARKIMNNTWK